MGTNFGKPTTTAATSNVNNNTTPENGIQFLSTSEMQKEFDDIYERSNLILKSLIKNPCKELEDRITNCLQSNPLKLRYNLEETEHHDACLTETDDVSKMVEQTTIIKEIKTEKEIS